MNHNPDAGAPHDGDSQGAIARRAYALWQQRGRPENRALEIWLEAEWALRDERHFRELLEHLDAEARVNDDAPGARDDDADGFAPDTGADIATGDGRLPARLIDDR